MCSRELSLDFPSIDRSRFSLLLLFSSGCVSARNVHSIFFMISFSFFFEEWQGVGREKLFLFFFWQQQLLLLYDEFGNPDILVKKKKRNGAVGWKKKDRYNSSACWFFGLSHLLTDEICEEEERERISLIYLRELPLATLAAAAASACPH